MVETLVDIPLSNKLLQRGNVLGQALGHSLLKGNQLNLEVGEYSIHLARSEQNLEALYQSVLSGNTHGVSYDLLTVFKGEDMQTQVLATGEGLCLSVPAKTIDELAIAELDRHDDYNTLTIGQIALLQHHDGPGGGEFVVADIGQTLYEIDAFLAQ